MEAMAKARVPHLAIDVRNRVAVLIDREAAKIRF